MDATLEMAKVTSKGQITIPKAVRDLLGIRSGDKVLFNENADGSVTMRNATVEAFGRARQAFAGAADEAGLSGEDDVNALVREPRAEGRDGRRG